MTEQPFGTESDPQAAEPATIYEHMVSEQQPAPQAEAAPEPPAHPAPAVPSNSPSWVHEIVAGLHERLAAIEHHLHL